MFSNGEFPTIGVLEFENESVFEGMIKDWDIGDKGTLTYPNGSVYDGFFKEGAKHGFGSFTDEHGNKYEGRWENDHKEGEGKEFIKEKQEFYEGTFRINKRDGFGRWINHKGELYIGSWRGGQPAERVKYHERVPPEEYHSLVDKFFTKKTSNGMEVKIFQ